MTVQCVENLHCYIENYIYEIFYNDSPVRGKINTAIEFVEHNDSPSYLESTLL